MKTATTLQFADLNALCKYVQVIHPSSYRIDTSKFTVKLSLTRFEVAIAVEEYQATVVKQLENA